MKTALVLFRGTGSVDRSLEKLGFHVDSLDMYKKSHATWTCDIMDWNYLHLEPGIYDFIWSSPPCTEYSRARTTAKLPRNFDLADSIVAKSLEIIRYFKPKAWLLENPQTGLLKTRNVIEGLPYRDICYCKYSDGIKHKYRKATRLWGFLPTFVPRPMCTRKDPCMLVVEGKHPECAQRFSKQGQEPYHHTLYQLYSMPEELTDSIAEAVVEFRAGF